MDVRRRSLHIPRFPHHDGGSQKSRDHVNRSNPSRLRWKCRLDIGGRHHCRHLHPCSARPAISSLCTRRSFREWYRSSYLCMGRIDPTFGMEVDMVDTVNNHRCPLPIYSTHYVRNA
nr:hypothetical protein I308_00008 [Cryptococcus tetragattii IND107]